VLELGLGLEKGNRIPESNTLRNKTMRIGPKQAYIENHDAVITEY
jgi:hypothetical protein